MFLFILRLVRANPSVNHKLFGSLMVDRSTDDVPSSMTVDYIHALHEIMASTPLVAGKLLLAIEGTQQLIHYIVPAPLAPYITENFQRWAREDFEPPDGPSPLTFFRFAMFGYDPGKCLEYLYCEPEHTADFKKMDIQAWWDPISNLFWTLNEETYKKALLALKLPA